MSTTDESPVKLHSHLHRLPILVASTPLFFITTCTHNKATILANDSIHRILVSEWAAAREQHGWMIGRYVVMPDHVHFICAPLPGGEGKPLSKFMGCWKEWSAKRIKTAMSLEGPVWQKQFFDHLLRNNESYSEKWEYVRQNPVRAALVESPEKWAWQGSIHFDEPR